MRRIFTIGFMILSFFLLPVQGTLSHSEWRIPDLTKSAIGNVDGKNLRKTVTHLQAYGNRSTWGKQWEVARWISKEFEMLGLEVKIIPYSFEGRNWPNVTARIKGHQEADQIIMIIAHMDTLSNHPERVAPGADDNGTGVAVILEVARILRKILVDRSVIFTLFSNEEKGTAGSKNYVLQIKKQGLNIRSVINLDVLGYNRPKHLFDLNTINAHGSLKAKTKTMIRMARNYLVGLKEGEDVVRVAGRVPNQGLVSLVSKILRASAGVKVKERVGNDCG